MASLPPPSAGFLRRLSSIRVSFATSHFAFTASSVDLPSLSSSSASSSASSSSTESHNADEDDTPRTSTSSLEARASEVQPNMTSHWSDDSASDSEEGLGKVFRTVTRRRTKRKGDLPNSRSLSSAFPISRSTSEPLPRTKPPFAHLGMKPRPKSFHVAGLATRPPRLSLKLTAAPDFAASFADLRLDLDQEALYKSTYNAALSIHSSSSSELPYLSDDFCFYHSPSPTSPSSSSPESALSSDNEPDSPTKGTFDVDHELTTAPTSALGHAEGAFSSPSTRASHAFAGEQQLHQARLMLKPSFARPAREDLSQEETIEWLVGRLLIEARGM